MRIALVLLILLTSACKGGLLLREPPRTVRVEVPVIIPVPDDLLRLHPIAEGPLSMCPQIAADRRRQLEQCNADKQAIHDRQTQPPK